MIRAGVLVIALAAAACAGGIDPVSTATGALGSGSGSGSGEDMPPPDPCANEFPWTMCTADLNTWQKAPYVDSCWIGAPKLLPVHTTMEVVVTCYDYTPRVDGNECKWDEKQWELGRRENTNHGTSTQTVCDHGPRIGQKVLIQTGSTGMMTDPMGGLALLGSLDCTCDGFNTFMGADSLDPASKLVGEVVAALRNTSCDLTNMTAADLAAAAVSMLWNGDFSPLWQCAANAVNQIRNRFHACNNDAATEQAAFWRGGSCPPTDQLPGLCQGPRWYF